MNKEQIMEDVSKYTGYTPSQLRYDGSKIILYLKENVTDDNASIRMHFYDFFAFYDSGLIGTTLSYFDIGVLGFANLYVARQKELAEEEYCQAVFITDLGSRKVELIIACKKIEIVSADSILE